MLVIKTCLEELDFNQLMEVYIEGNEENAREFYPELSGNLGVKRAEQDFYGYLQNNFFRKEGVKYVIWEEDGEYISALRLEPWQDGLLLEALETKPSHRNKGYACMLIEAIKQEISQTIYSHIGKWNMLSLRTHEKCGFERISENVIYADGSVSERSCTMCLKRNL